MTKTNYSTAYTNIMEYLSKLEKDTVDYYIAKALLNKINLFPDIYIEEIATAANTTAPSVTKFCKKLGYSSFNDFKNDIYHYEKDTFFQELRNTTYNSPSQYIHNYLNFEQDITNQIINHVNLDMIHKLSKDISQSKQVVFLVADYNMNIVSIFSEILSLHNITFTTINRDLSNHAILQASIHADVILTSSISGEWIKQRKDLIPSLSKPFHFITLKKIDYPNTIYLDNQSNIAFNSFYETQRYLTIIFLLIDYQLKDLFSPQLSQ